MTKKKKNFPSFLKTREWLRNFDKLTFDKNHEILDNWKKNSEIITKPFYGDRMNYSHKKKIGYYVRGSIPIKQM